MIENHPTEARRFAKALEPFLIELVRESEGNEQQSIDHISKSSGETPGEEHADATDDTVWMKAKDVAQVFGYKAQWAISKKHLLPQEYVKKEKPGMGRGKPAWKFHPDCIGLLNQYL